MAQPKNRLTDEEIKRYIKNDERFEGKSDGGGLYLRFRKEDSVPSWRFRYRYAGRQRVFNIGSYGTFTLAQARKVAKELKARVMLGEDVAASKQDTKRENLRRMDAKTVSALAQDFYERQVLGVWKHPNIIKNRIDNDLVPAIGHIRAEDLRPADIQRMLDKVVARGAPTVANDLLRWTKRIMNRALKLQLIDVNPAESLDMSDAGGSEGKRDRALSTAELNKLFAALNAKAGGVSQHVVAAVKLLLMLACRKSELIAAKVAEFDLDEAVWRLPDERSKNGHGIDIPLPPQAVTIIRELVDLSCNTGYLFPAVKQQTRMQPFLSDSTINAALNKHVRPTLAKQGVEPFTVHDLRRTARTLLSGLTTPHIAERCLNHTIAGVQGTYDRHDYYEERKEALEKLANKLDEMQLSDVV